MAASYPTSIKSFTTKVDGVDDVQADHVNDLQLEVAALETQLLTTGTWAPTFTGFSADPANGVYRYLVIGDWVFLDVRMPSNGTSNAVGFTITLPFTAKTITNMAWFSAAVGIDNSATLTTAARAGIASGATVIDLKKDFSGADWTNAGGKRASFSIHYQKA